jgi:hypothetical protein
MKARSRETGRGLFRFHFPSSDGGPQPGAGISSKRMMRGAIEARRRPNQLPARANAAGRGLSPSREIGFRPEMSRRVPIAQALPRFSQSKPSDVKETLHGFRRLFDRARRERADPHRALGGFLVSARIIQFVPRASFGQRAHQAPRPFRFPRLPDDLAMDHADTAPCEYALPPWQCEGDDEPA